MDRTTFPGSSRTAGAETLDLAQIRAKVNQAVEQGGLAQAEAARLAGVNPSTLNKFLKGNYNGDNAEVAGKLQRWVVSYNRQRESQQLPDPGWIATPSAERVLDVLTTAQEEGDLVAIHGEAGVGKSVTCRHYAAQNPNVWVLTCSPAANTIMAALEEVAEAVGLRELPSGAARLQREVKRRLRGTHGLLIVDEAQHLGLSVIETLRSIYDDTGIGLALVGNTRILSRMNSAGQMALFAQITSRLGVRLSLKKPSAGDVRSLAVAWRVGDEEAVKLAKEIAGTPGALRSMVKAIRRAGSLELIL